MSKTRSSCKRCGGSGFVTTAVKDGHLSYSRGPGKEPGSLLPNQKTKCNCREDKYSPATCKDKLGKAKKQARNKIK